MDRRTYTFVVASAAFLFFYLSLRTLVVPPQPPPNVPPADEIAQPADESAEGEKLAADLPSGDKPDQPEDAEDDAGDSTTQTTEWYTLGSMNPADEHQLLIYFRNRGAAIERIELTAREEDGSFAYRRVDTRSGYLGYFAGTASERIDGLHVNVIGPGSPATTATTADGQTGIQVGDVIIAVAGAPVQSEQEIAEALRETKPGDSVVVEVVRGENADAAAAPLLFDVTLTEHPLDLIRLAKDGGDDQIVGNLSRLSSLMTLAQVGRKGISTGKRALDSLPLPENQTWTANVTSGDNGSQSIRFETNLGAKAMQKLGGQPVRMVRSFTIEPSSYIVDMDMEVINLGDTPQQLAYRLEGPNGLTDEGWWYSTKISPNFSGAAARDVVYRTAADGHELISGMTLLKETRKTPEEPNYGLFAADSDAAARQLSYIGVDAQYFAVSYIPADGEALLNQFDRASAMIVADEAKIKANKERAINVSFFLNSSPASIAPGESIRQSLRMFAGPKEPELLNQYGIGDFVYYGWFSFFSSILSGLLHVLQSIVQNYGIAIVLLTVIVRGLMFPLSRNAAVNAQRMQELAPEMKKIAEKYKDDMEGRLKAQQALQKRVGFNPLAGCLPMFLQLPIFMGLYRALSVDIDLRQKPLFSPNGWASNLAAPDQLLYWGDWMPEFFSGRGTGWLGPYLNILPLFVVVLFITQQKLFMPPATDEQTAMTQKVMTFMTLFMGLFFFRVPAGLCIYFIASSLWGIGERLLVKKTLPKGKHFDLELDSDGDVIDAVATSKSSRAGSGKPKLTLAEKLMAQVNPQEPEQPVERPSKRKRPPGNKKR
ncbi:YidC/Oxa1 family insertase periplasmic-domain containing protein [Stieleria sp. TO1_6]|uniref:YidC/Oxa1 family insertase periplasmic-domain containing protein n=1 Tax=Stieleria tagensis TaxID=2956795 RepID=UPI00209B4C90|nr:YidC/Oxa1 family insertase periplasmic-domain containing protein [Stieleria tagensis]MCO8121363.1 YidC/Oxa1 family insertase periplasmic-domain containing protein [Stieleria tagensis]